MSSIHLNVISGSMLIARGRKVLQDICFSFHRPSGCNNISVGASGAAGESDGSDVLLVGLFQRLVQEERTRSHLPGPPLLRRVSGFVLLPHHDQDRPMDAYSQTFFTKKTVKHKY